MSVQNLEAPYLSSAVALEVVPEQPKTTSEIYIAAIVRHWESLEIYMAAAQINAINANTQCAIMWSYVNVGGEPQDAAEAVVWYQKAAAQGHANAQFNLGVMYAMGEEGLPQDTTKAVELYQKAAEQGHAQAQYAIGWRYANGEGVPRDFAKAVEWYQKAAVQGDIQAQYAIGWSYDKGECGCTQDFTKAVEWYQKAAGQGDVNAQFNLAGMYFNGEGIAQDSTLAYAWANLAAVSGDDESVERRNLYESKLSLVEKNKAHRLSSGWTKWQVLGMDSLKENGR